MRSKQSWVVISTDKKVGLKLSQSPVIEFLRAKSNLIFHFFFHSSVNYSDKITLNFQLLLLLLLRLHYVFIKISSKLFFEKIDSFWKAKMSRICETVFKSFSCWNVFSKVFFYLYWQFVWFLSVSIFHVFPSTDDDNDNKYVSFAVMPTCDLS